MKVRVLPYKMASESGKALASGLKALRVRRDSSKFKPREGDVVINWGSSSGPAEFSPYLLNSYEAVAKASNKLHTFQTLQEGGLRNYTPQFSTDRFDAVEWAEKGRIVVCRTALTGHSGEGIVLAENEEEIVPAPLYTQYIKKTKEWRVHCTHDEVFFVQRKARKREVPDDQVNWKIRNHQNGFIYAHNEGEPIANIARLLAMKAVQALGLDFGAVDIIETANGSFFILEVNTACGLTGATVDAYVNFFQKEMGLKELIDF